MNPDRLVAMANDIAAFFAGDPDPQAAAANVANHLRRFWAPRMRTQIVAHLRSGGHGLSALARAAVEQLAASSSPQP
jgi:formate dehydrogenase subunit delta